MKEKDEKVALFTDAGYLAVFKSANGVKRMINRTVLNCLMYGVSKKLETIDQDSVFQAQAML